MHQNSSTAHGHNLRDNLVTPRASRRRDAAARDVMQKTHLGQGLQGGDAFLSDRAPHLVHHVRWHEAIAEILSYVGADP